MFVCSHNYPDFLTSVAKCRLIWTYWNSVHWHRRWAWTLSLLHNQGSRNCSGVRDWDHPNRGPSQNLMYLHKNDCLITRSGLVNKVEIARKLNLWVREGEGVERWGCRFRQWEAKVVYCRPLAFICWIATRDVEEAAEASDYKSKEVKGVAFWNHAWW